MPMRLLILLLFLVLSSPAFSQTDTSRDDEIILLADSVKELASAEYSGNQIKAVLPNDAGEIKTIQLINVDDRKKKIHFESLYAKDENITITFSKKLKTGTYFLTVKTSKDTFQKKIDVN